MASGSWSRNPEDLSAEPLLHASPKFDLEGADRPSVGKYVLLSKLGQGGMGVVYHATHKKLGNEVAIKLRPRGPQRSEEEMLARFVREAQIAARLRSSHLVSVLDIDEDGPSHCDFIVMEYVNGLSGSQWLEKHGGRAPESEALDVCIAATRGLEAAHLQGIVHRDIKPSNILIPFDSNGDSQPELAKLCDLGLARPEAAGENITRTQIMMGTPGYMAPEQAASARRANKPADVLSMGATLFKFLTGRAPFKNPANEEWLLWTVNGTHSDAVELRPDLTPATAALLDTCLRLDVSERFPDASALLVALQVCRSSIGFDMDAETVIGDVQSLVSRAEEGLPAHSTADLGGTDTTQPALPGDRAQAGSAPPLAETVPPSAVRLEAVTAAAGDDDAMQEAPRRSRVPLFLALIAATAAVAVIAWSPWNASPQDDPDGTSVSIDMPGLYVTSVPAGALVAVDGTERGRTPLLVPDLADGSHAVSVSLEYYDTWSTVEAKTKLDQHTPLPCPLARSLVAVQVRGGAPGAQVTLTHLGEPPHSRAFNLDGSGSTELSDVEAGRYSVRANAPGHESLDDETRIVRATSGTPTLLQLAMVALPGSLSVTSTPAGARCSVDGKVVGTTPIEGLGVGAGRHALLFELDGYGVRTIDVELAPGQERSFEAVELSRWGTLALDGLDEDVQVTLPDGRRLADGESLSNEPTVLLLTKPGHAVQEHTVTVPLGQRLSVPQTAWSQFIARLDLSRLPSDVTAVVDGETRSGVVVYDRAVTVTVRLEREGSRPQELPTELQLGDTRPIEAAEWEPLLSRVDLSGLGSDVTVEIDGKPVSTGQELGAGEHLVRLVKRGAFEPQEFTVTVRPGEPLRVEPQEPFEALLTWAAATEMLKDIEKWDAAGNKARLQVGALVVERTPGFTYERLELFEGGGVKHEIAVFTHTLTGLEFSLVPGGTFRMGATVSEAFSGSTERPAHEVHVKPMLIARTECTQAAWQAGGGDLREQTFRGADRPVAAVSWTFAADWCERSGLSLPSEAQWEHACRAGTTTVYWPGNAEGDLDRIAWCRGNAEARTHAVGEKPANAFGLHDTHGNVLEWCEDTWHADYEGAPTDGSAWVAGASEQRVIRGGCYDHPAKAARAAYRHSTTSRDPYVSIGFRPVRSVPTD